MATKPTRTAPAARPVSRPADPLAAEGFGNLMHDIHKGIRAHVQGAAFADRVSGRRAETAAVTAIPGETTEQRQLRYMVQNLDGDRSYLDSLVSFYMSNLIAGTKTNTRTAFLICAGVENSMEIDKIGSKAVKFPLKKSNAPGKAKGNYYKLSEQGRTKVVPQDWETIKTFFAKGAKDVDILDRDITFRNLNRLFELLNLDDTEKSAMKLLYVAKRVGLFSSLVSNIFNDDLKQASVGFARMTGMPENAAKIYSALHFTGRLGTYGLVTMEGPSDPESMLNDEMTIPTIDEDLLSCLDKPDMSDEEIVSVILGNQRKSELNLADFEHVGDPVHHVAHIIKQAVASGKKGINILLYGPAGSGKTELCAVIAQELGFKIYAVGEDDGHGAFSIAPPSESTGRQRIAQLGRSHALLKGSKDSFVLFDEIEDLLIKGGDSKKAADSESKIGINRLLEENPVVTIWTGNEPSKLIEAVRQRMTYSVYMDYPPTIVREKIWRRRLAIEGCSLSDGEIRDLSRRYAPPPRLISKAVEVLALTGGGMKTVEQVLRASSKLSMGQSEAILVDDPLPAGFGLDFLNADCNIKEVFNTLSGAAKAKQAFSLLVHDKPELGGTEFLRLMAEEMGMNPVEVDIRDLMAPHPMAPPEAKIKAVFDTATDSRGFLILKGMQDMVPNPHGQSQEEWHEPVVEMMVKEALMHSLPLAMTVKQGVKIPPHVDVIFSNHVTMKPIDRAQSASLYQKFTGEDMPEHLSHVLDGVAPVELLKLKTILEKAQGGGVDHERAARALEQMKGSRPSGRGAAGYVHR